MLLKGFRKPILNLSLGHHHPVGIDRALQHLPPKVLSADSYRHLVDLLNDPATAKFLHHSASITELKITALHNLPPALRTAAILAMLNRIDGMPRFVDGLRFLAARAGLPFDTLATQIGGLDQPDKVVAKIRQLVDGLPLPNTLPPVDVGGFRRLDTVAEIRELAKKWQNCLADYLFSVNNGTSAIYLSDERQAACFVSRHGRQGWFLVQAKGPRNVDIAVDQLAQIYHAFADVGILPSSIVEAIKSIVVNHEWSCQADDQEEIFDHIALY